MTVNRFAGQVFTPAKVSTDTPKFDQMGNLSMENRAAEAKAGYLGQAEVAAAGFKGVERIAAANAQAAQIEANATVAAANSEAGAISSIGSSIGKGISGLNIGGGGAGIPGTTTPSVANSIKSGSGWSGAPTAGVIY